MAMVVKVAKMAVIVVAGFLLSVLVMNLIGGAAGRTPEQIGVFYGIGQLAVWIGFVVIVTRLTTHLGDRP